jgi:hypothetical protein
MVKCQRDNKGRYIKGHDINLGSKRTEETCRRISVGNTGKKMSKETIEKNRFAHLGRKHDPIKMKRIRENNNRNKGYINIIDEGYVYFYYPEHPNCDRRGLIRIHRLMIEKIIGRLLTNTEEVHHVDKNKENNNLLNLMLFATKSAHRRFEFGISKVFEHEIIFDGRKLCQK